MLKIILKLLIRAMNVGIKLDNNIKTDFECLPNNYIIKIKVNPTNTQVAFKYENGKIVGLKEENITPNLTVEFKDKKSATKCLLGLNSLASAFCEHRIKIYGNINNSMALTRIVNRLESYLFPKFMCDKLFNPPYTLESSKFKFYCTLLFGGKLWNILNL